ncbi:MAG: class B sortase [Clostridia bacterium]|nr:class B sortase [Clostridia bacterium]
MNKRYKIILLLLIVILAISSCFFIKEIAENKKEIEIYEELQEIVQEEENLTHEDDHTGILKNETSNKSNEKSSNNYNLENISKINTDVIGWIKIEGTNINYPVMQNGNYYLHRNIYKSYSKHGTPYLAEYCDFRKSDNLIIYGHNMKDGSMFSKLTNYDNYKFYQEHKYIDFYTLEAGETIKNTYEIAVVLKTTAYSDNSFKYYNYINFSSAEELNAFIEKSRELELYNTGLKISYGDKLLTLSTCEYSQENGRIVVIAKKI